MPYNSINDLPPAFKEMKPEQKAMALKVMNACMAGGKADEQTCIMRAMGAAKNMKM
jgi:hypothetical protein